MPVFEVYLNGKKAVTAGIGPQGVLDTSITWASRETGSAKPSKGEFCLHVGGLHGPTGDHWHWLDRPLKVGDKICVRVAQEGAIDPPQSRERRDEAQDLRQQQRYVRQLAKSWGWKIIAT